VGFKLFSVYENGVKRRLGTEAWSSFPYVLPGGRHTLVTIRDNIQEQIAIDIIGIRAGKASQVNQSSNKPFFQKFP